MSVTQYPDACMPIDCSAAAQDDRWKKLKDLNDRLYSGVQSVSDRSRSVTYLDATNLRKLINALTNEIALCGGCLARRNAGRRLFYVAYDRWF